MDTELVLPCRQNIQATKVKPAEMNPRTANLKSVGGSAVAK